jgi:hypothetical protein
MSRQLYCNLRLADLELRCPSFLAAITSTVVGHCCLGGIPDAACIDPDPLQAIAHSTQLSCRTQPWFERTAEQCPRMQLRHVLTYVTE